MPVMSFIDTLSVSMGILVLLVAAAVVIPLCIQFAHGVSQRMSQSGVNTAQELTAISKLG